LTTIRFVFNSERRYRGLIEHLKSGNNDLDITCRDIGVLVAAFVHLTCNLEHKLPPGMIFIPLACQRFAKKELGNTIAVAEIHKCDRAKFPDGLNPSCKGYFLACMFHPEFSAGM